MSFDSSRVDLLLQFALLAAGEEDDPRERALGPIHLIKYVYLGDLAYARRNAGAAFTGIDWRFYKFGPWSQAVYDRIEPALSAIGAEKRTFESDYDDRGDWCRWSLRRDDLMSEVERRVPSAISATVKPLIHRYGSETAALLDHVYRTPPMLSAAPNERLNLSLAVNDVVEREPHIPALKAANLSARKRRQLTERMQALQRTAHARPVHDSQLINPVKNARYDAVFQDGVAWLDELAGQRPPLGDAVAEFSDDVWKSSTRKGSDVP